MSFNFASIEHALATVCSDIVKGARAVTNFLSKVREHEKEIEDFTMLVASAVPGAAIAVPLERAGFAVLGHALKAVNSVDAAASANGLNVQLDAQMVSDLRELLPVIKAQLAASGVKL